MKFFVKPLLIVLFFVFSNKLYASHVSGADITYKWISGNTYEITVNLFRDCSGITPSTTAPVDFVSTCGQTANLICTLTNEGGTEISQLCDPEIPNSTCSGGILPGMQRYTFKGLITLPAQCDTWTMSWSECCRNTSDNLTTSSSWDMYTETKLNSSSFQSNSSPVFTAMPVPYVCQGQPVNYSHGVVEQDGDVLVYSLVAALDGGVDLAYNAPYSATSPITGITIDAATGQLSFTPTTVGKFVVVIRVDEYTAGGVLKGSVIRDIQFVVQPCGNTVPSSVSPAGIINAGSFVGVGAVRTGNFTVGMCEGNSFTFKSIYTDANATDILTYTSNVTTALPGSTISQTGTNPMTLTISWTAPIGFPPQTQAFYVTVEDGACPIPGTQTFVYNIQISDLTSAGPDKVYCPGGLPVTLDGIGGNTFTWAKLGGGTTYLSCTNCQVPTITGALPAGVHSYTVTSDLLGCKNKDTVVVTSVASFSYTPVASPATICKYGSSTLSTGLGAGYSYTWSPGSTLSATGSASPLVSPYVPTTYTVIATSSAGCSQQRIVSVNVSGVAPILNASATDYNICSGEVTSLTATAYSPALVCGVPSTACTGTTTVYQAGNGTLTTTTASPFYGGWHDARAQYIYTVAELNALGYYGGVIKTLAFKLGTKSSTAAYSGFTIKMGCTATNEFTSSVPSFETVGTVVFGPSNYTPTANSWNTFTLAGNGYEWDGASNIIVEVCYDNTAYTSSDNIEYTTTTSFLTAYAYGDGVAGCSMAGESRTQNRPNMQFGVCANSTGITYAWSPATALSSTSSQTPTANPTTSITYTVTATKSGCSSLRQLAINVGPNYTITTSATPATICKGNTSTLSATPSVGGTYSYTWTPSSTLSNPNISNPIATPTETTTYTVAMISSGGCDKTATRVVTVSGAAPIMSATASELFLCVGDVSSLTASASVPPVSCGAAASACTGSSSTAKVGSGTSTSSTASPFYGGWHDGRTQYIYTKAELNAMGFYGGVITSVGFVMGTKSSTAAYSGFTIKMGCTNLSSFATAVFETGLTTVYGASNHTTVANSTNTFALTGNGYNWDGTSNLIVETCFNNTAYTSSDAVQYSTTAVARALYDYADSDVGCTLSTPFTTTTRPNIVLTMCSVNTGVTYSWSPATNLSSTTSATPTATPTADITYTVTGTASGCSANASVFINTGAVFSLTMSPAVTVCSGSSTSLAADPSDDLRTYTYLWTPSTSLNNATAQYPTATPTANTVYTVDVISNDGCSQTGSVSVTMGPGNLTVSAATSSSTICYGSTATLTASSTVAAVACSTYPTGCTGVTSYTGTLAGRLDGTTSGSAANSPFARTNKNGINRQYLYTKADLDAIFGGTGPRVITSLAFYATSVGTISGIRVGLKCTSLTALTSTFETGITQVRAAADVTTINGWSYINFDTPYLWDGVSNLIVQICTAKLNAATMVVRQTTVANTVIAAEVGGAGCAITTGTLSGNRPNIRFNGCVNTASTLTYAWTPTTGLSSPNTAVTNATPTASTTYTVVGTDPGTGCNDSKSVAITVNKLDAGPDVTICNNSSTTFIASYSGASAAGTCGAAAVACSATSSYTVGSGTSTFASGSSGSYGNPFNGYYHDGRNQMLYTKADLNAAGITGPATLNQLAFYVATKASTAVYNGFNIKIGCTSLTSLTTAIGWQTGLTTVYSGNYTPTSNSWNVFNFTGNGYDWDGNSNIIVETCFDNTGYTSSDAVQYTTTAVNSVISNYADNNTGCTMAVSSATTSRANIRFGACAVNVAPTYAWTSTPSPRISGPTNVSSITTTVLTAPVTYTIVGTTSMCTLTDVVVANIGSPANLRWTGVTSTDWFTASNWDLNCVPGCPSNVVIPSGAPNMPLIATGTTASCDTITINTGASLTISGTGILSVCGDYVNNGTLTAAATSTILFGNGSIVQNVTGNLSGANKFGHLTITKTGGSTILANDIDIAGNFTTSNATSLFNTNGRYIKLAGHFLNNAGGATFSNVTGTIEFNGTTLQSYSAGNDNLVLANVVMNQPTASSVYLVNQMTVRLASSLSLISGKIVTNAKEVRLLSPATGAVNAGNTTSYVEGNLRRKLSTSGSYDFPVGHATPGYERMNLNFASTAGIDNLLVRFDPYASIPAAPGWSECAATYNLPALNNGFWTADAYDNTFAAIGATALGTYDATLYNAVGSYNNNTGANGWTVMKAPSGTSTWALNGSCVVSGINSVQRASMNGFSKLATAQSSVPLPINLLNFTGKTIAFTNHLEWNTSREENSDYFMLQRSKDGENFENLVRVKAQGNSSNVVNYKETDKEPFITSYYRLMMVDKNGDVRYSEIVTLYLPDNSYNVTIRPNPASSNLFVDIYSSASVVAQVEILDMVGRIVATKQVALLEGNNNIDNDLSNVAKGVYFVRLTTNNSVLFNGKFIKQ